VTDCSHYVVLTYRTKITEADLDQYMNLVAKTRGAPVESLQGFRKMLEGDLVKGPRSENIHWWAQKQCYIAMGMLMETAALLEIDTCPLEGLDPKAYDKILKLEGTGYATVAAVACGFRAADDKYQEAPKVRYQRDEVFQVI
jgi:nitroreductase